jgi:predicted Rossmann fold nucleotide-binding protein DprA/Smf involved in DNA uptake
VSAGARCGVKRSAPDGVCPRCEGSSRMSVRLHGAPAGAVENVCRHHCLYPERLRANPAAPDVLSMMGGAERLSALFGAKVVAILATDMPSEYGSRVAHALTRDLAASGVTVAGVPDGIGEEACAWAHEAGGSALAIEACVGAGSVDLDCSADAPTSDRALALLADLVIVIEAEQGDWDEAHAEQTRSYGAQVAAVPGPVDSVSSLASNALIAEGAEVICTAQDALDALYGVGRRRVRRKPRRKPRERSLISKPASADVIMTSPELEPNLVAVLERVAHGEDTLAKLCEGKQTCGELTLALTELELLGLLRRDQDGRYLPA